MIGAILTDPRPDGSEPEPGLGPDLRAEPARRWPTGATTTLELRAGGLVVAKRRHPRDRAATEAEGRWLATARHPGVVRLRRVAPADGLIETELAGLATLAAAPLDRAATALVLAAVARTLADLHRRSLFHGQLWPEHVVLAGPQRSTPVLCSPWTVWGSTSGQPDRHDDVVGLAHLAQALWDHRAGDRQRAGHRGWYGDQRPAGDRHWAEVVDQLTNDPRATPSHAARCFDRLARRHSGRRRAASAAQPRRGGSATGSGGISRWWPGG